MMKTVLRKTGLRLVAVSALCFSTAAHAYVDCTEQVLSVIMHSNGSVYFITNHTCTAGWCQLSWSSPEAISKGYAMLLSAQAQGKSISFAWDNISSCSTANQVYASPAFMSLSP